MVMAFFYTDFIRDTIHSFEKILVSGGEVSSGSFRILSSILSLANRRTL